MILNPIHFEYCNTKNTILLPILSLLQALTQSILQFTFYRVNVHMVIFNNYPTLALSYYTITHIGTSD